MVKFCPHLIDLIFPHLGSHDGVERNHEDHDGQTSQGAGPQDAPEEVHAEHDAQGTGPGHVEEGHQVHEPLGVQRHQVGRLSH